MEKATQETIEDVKSPDPRTLLDAKFEKHLLWKCDLHVVPILTLLFMLAFLDRINIGNARLMGLEDDLKMSGHQYNIALASILAGALLAYAINNMDGLAGYSGWRWIFIIEGLATIVAAVISKFIIVDWPETASFLTEDERALLLRRLSEDQGEAKMNRLDKRSVAWIFTDPKIYLGPIMYFGIVNTGYAVSFFTPTILNQLGWTAVRAQVMSIPIYAIAMVVSLSMAFLSDRLKHRYGFTLAGCLIATTGYVLLICQTAIPVGARYFALVAITSGGYLTQPILMGWLSNNMGGHYKQSVASAMQIGFGNCGGLVASNIFYQKEAPGYHTGYRRE
ncbi:uncharacterized protein ATNIH1004_000839 [Aspergillus tanneri]|uniref:Major facilitator superfamily (MFS) profile domain-containing protein n=1 Tax=Aspergillus tanneri TaxID=1220188 RepID=A0A5M9N2Q7_9EURO|nr:uncharacterized protein ATNIH1004_000839 [Aspergillus tanneri]KAA8651940.1 hypothetical protein ATNIH1004_000839 [Aspergillus tanneri]